MNLHKNRRPRMNYIFKKLLMGIIVFSALFLFIDQYAEGIIGDTGKQSPTGIIGDTGKPSPTGIIGDTGKPSPDVIQSFNQDIMKIKDEIKMAEAKLNKAHEGDDLFVYTVTKTSIPNLKSQINELSLKITGALTSKNNDREWITLSNDMKDAKSILNILELRAKANMKGESLKLLEQFSAAIQILQNDINKLGPQPEPPD